jgi:acetylornithine deacetylase/succinyl-diaminopimelate desuccinylase-like protein
MMEQLIVILVFAICSAVCVSIFVESYLTERGALEMKNAILAASSAAESYKASDGDARKTVMILGGFHDEAVFYDESWAPCAEDQAAYILRIARIDDPYSLLILAEITVSKITGEELFSLPAAVRGGI